MAAKKKQYAMSFGMHKGKPGAIKQDTKDSSKVYLTIENGPVLHVSKSAIKLIK